jgi:hypothetical protein
MLNDAGAEAMRDDDAECEGYQTTLTLKRL